MVDVRRMSLAGTGLGMAPLMARVQDLIPSPDGIRDLDVVWMQRLDRDRRARRIVRLHLTGPVDRPVHQGDLVYAVGRPEVGPAGGLRLTLPPDRLLIAHAHDDPLDPALPARLLSQTKTIRASR